MSLYNTLLCLFFCHWGGGGSRKPNREDSLPFMVLNDTHMNTELFVSFILTQSFCGNSHLIDENRSFSRESARIFRSIHTCNDQRSIVFFNSLNQFLFIFGSGQFLKNGEGHWIESRIMDSVSFTSSGPPLHDIVLIMSRTAYATLSAIKIQIHGFLLCATVN